MKITNIIKRIKYLKSRLPYIKNTFGGAYAIAEIAKLEIKLEKERRKIKNEN